MFFLISNLIIVVIILFLLYVLSAVWPPDSPWAPWWQMPESVCVASALHAKVTKNDIVYDLGCGTGKALIIANTQFGAKGIGIEIDPLRSFLAKFNVWKVKKFGYTQSKPLTLHRQEFSLSNRSASKGKFSVDVKIIKNNFYKVDLSDATVVYFYLVPNALRRLTKKLMKELKPGTRIVSYVYDLPETYEGKVKLLKYDKENNIYIYKVV